MAYVTVGLLAYGFVVAYVAVAAVWSRASGGLLGHAPPPEPEPLPKLPATPVLPEHPHSNMGWESSKSGHVHIACRAADADLVRKIDPLAEMGRHYCHDCERVIGGYVEESAKVGERRATLADEYRAALEEWRNATGLGKRRWRNPMLWPLWVLWYPVEVLWRRRGNGVREELWETNEDRGASAAEAIDVLDASNEPGPLL